VSVRLRVASPCREPSTGSPASTCGAGSTGLTLNRLFDIGGSLQMDWGAAGGRLRNRYRCYLAKRRSGAQARKHAPESPAHDQCHWRCATLSGMPLQNRVLAGAFDAYARKCPDQASVAADFHALLGDAADPFVRDRLDGHFTASAWLVDRSRTRV